jgi:hypothetical protein
MEKIAWVTPHEMQHERDNLCIVCFREIEMGRRLSCGHIIHDDCIKMWVDKTNKEWCPKCKRSFYEIQPS